MIILKPFHCYAKACKFIRVAVWIFNFNAFYGDTHNNRGEATPFCLPTEEDKEGGKYLLQFTLLQVSKNQTLRIIC